MQVDEGQILGWRLLSLQLNASVQVGAYGQGGSAFG